MSSGADPFSILNSDPSRGQYTRPQAAPKVNRYRTGKKPVLLGHNVESSDSDDEFDLFGDNKTKISKFSDTGSKMSMSDTNFSSKVIKKGKKGRQEMKNLAIEISKNSSKNAVQPRMMIQKVVDLPKKHQPIKKKLKINSKVQNVVRRRVRRSAEEVAAQKSSQPDTMVIEESQDVKGRGSGTTPLRAEPVELVSDMQQEKNSVARDGGEMVTMSINNVHGGSQIVNGTEIPDPSNKLRTMIALEDQASEEEDNSDNGSGSEEDEESDSEEESEAGAGFSTQIKRPVFINEEQREAFKDESGDLFDYEEERKKKRKAIKQQNNQMVIQAQAVRTEDLDKDNESDTEVPNDDDDDENEAYRLWRMRELARLKRDRELREKEFKEEEATEKRRMMTDEERKKDDKRIGKYKKTMRSDMRFMQRYHHVGIFVDDPDDPLFKRDYNIGVGTDNFDKSNLPKRLQTRRGQEGKRGHSKYTHLGDEDTTNFDPNYQPHDEIRQSVRMKQAGYKSSGLFSRPSRRKRNT